MQASWAVKPEDVLKVLQDADGLLDSLRASTKASPQLDKQVRLEIAHLWLSGRQGVACGQSNACSMSWADSSVSDDLKPMLPGCGLRQLQFSAELLCLAGC
eukprot:1161051-Pelagomonas_calceolata.AAC.2